MSNLEAFVSQACSLGVRFDGITPRFIAGKGFGIVAERTLDAGHVLLSVPVDTLKTYRTVPQEIRNAVEGISVQGLLALDLILDKSRFSRIWKSLVPKRKSMVEGIPFWWNPSLHTLLPETASRLVDKQNKKLGTDWNLVSANFPTIAYDDYAYFWFLIGTRTFYFTYADEQDEQDPEDCLALVPIADLFNHADSGCQVTFSSEDYNFCTDRMIEKGEEIYLSYGNHNNDFLLAEYGFCLDLNKWDEISLDPVLLTLFNEEQKKILESESYWGGFILGANSACYRTEVALRLLCMPQDLWQLRLQAGFEDDDEYKGPVDDILLQALGTYSSLVTRKIEQISRLDPAFAQQKNILKKRWEQVGRLIHNAIVRLKIEQYNDSH